MIFRQIAHDDLGCASYLVGDDDAGVAAWSTRAWTSTSTCGLRATWACASSTCSRPTTTPTTSPATGGSWRRRARPSTSTAPRRPSTTTSLRRRLGAGARHVVVRALHTPGHRPEHTAFALVDTERGPEPWAVLTGDSLFVGDIARPDLAVDQREGARGIFHSLHERLLALPDTSRLARAPGRLALRRPSIDLKVASTIGYERATSGGARRRRRGRVRRARDRQPPPAAAELPRHRRHQHAAR